MLLLLLPRQLLLQPRCLLLVPTVAKVQAINSSSRHQRRRQLSPGVLVDTRLHPSNLHTLPPQDCLRSRSNLEVTRINISLHSRGSLHRLHTLETMHQLHSLDSLRPLRPSRASSNKHLRNSLDTIARNNQASQVSNTSLTEVFRRVLRRHPAVVSRCTLVLRQQAALLTCLVCRPRHTEVLLAQERVSVALLPQLRHLFLKVRG